MNLRVGSFCSGIAAPEVAWRGLGWRPQWFSEIEPFPCAVLAHHFAGVRNLGDMTKVSGEELQGSVDVLVAGTPCQAFSVAGKRESLADDRGNLTLTFVELVHGIEPRWVVWENVPGVLNTKDNAFGCFLAGLVGEGEPLVCRDNAWPVAGMVVGPRRTAAWRVLDAQYVGLAQRRRRVFVVSCRTGDGINPGAVLFEPESLPRNTPPSREAGERTTGTIAARTKGGGGLGTDFDCDGGLIPIPIHQPDASDRDDPRDGCGIGNPGDPMFTLRDRSRDAVAIRTAQTGANGCGIAFDAAHTLDTSNANQAIAFNWQAGGSKAMVGGKNNFTDALQSSQIPAVAFTQNQAGDVLTGRVCPSMGTNQNATGRNTPKVQAGMAVRRLTPRECERLQGFPDDYTAIPFRNKPAADGPRYRALGNSMAVPVLRWIGERIEKVEAAVTA